MVASDLRSSSRPRVAIAIPARDEAERLPYCLRALARQRRRGFAIGDVAVLVLANNCTDATAAIARDLAPTLPFRLIVREIDLSAASAHAGIARGLAMDAAAALLGPDGVLLTTDADAVPSRSWLAENLAAIDRGADAVAGAMAPDATELAALPALLRRQCRQERRYAVLLDRIAAMLDPEPGDPWPRHPWHSGASMALTRLAWTQLGGLPRLIVGEDRAFFAAVRRAGLRLRHAPGARVTVSCRLQGRAAAGMAETLCRRLVDAKPTADDGLESLRQAMFRLRRRRDFRLLRRDAERRPLFSAVTGVSGPVLDDALAAGFWSGWEAIEAASPLLRRRPLPLAALPAEIAAAEAVIAAMAPRFAADRADNVLPARGRAPQPAIPVLT